MSARNTTSVQISIEASDRRFIQNLHHIAKESNNFEVSDPTRIPGFGETIYEIAVVIGLTSLPLGVLGNLIGSWIWDAMQKRDGAPDATITIREGDKEVHFKLSGQDREAVVGEIARSLDRLRIKREKDDAV